MNLNWGTICSDDYEIRLKGVKESSHAVPARKRECVRNGMMRKNMSGAFRNFAKYCAKLIKKNELHNC